VSGPHTLDGLAAAGALASCQAGGLTARSAPTTVADALAAWVTEPPPLARAARPLQVLNVTVRRPAARGATGTTSTRYTGVFGSSFAAYDDALERFPDACRVEVKPATEGSAHAPR
jgi:hypothetical protein